VLARPAGTIVVAPARAVQVQLALSAGSRRLWQPGALFLAAHLMNAATACGRLPCRDSRIGPSKRQ
jgi:hypothetical protein